MVSNANYMKLKTNLSLSIQRLKLLEKKKTELAQKSRKEIAEYLQAGKVERAKIRVEHIIREDFLVEAMEIVEMYCDTLLARFGMIEQLKTMDEGIEEAVSSLIWIAPRMQSDVKELKVVADILTYKYGKPYAQAARDNSFKTVNEKLMVKMGVQAPSKILVERYLIEIAKCMNVPYEPDEEILRENEKYNPGSFSGASSLGPPPLIDLGMDALSLNPSQQPLGGPVFPPPLPSMPPATTGTPGKHPSAPGPNTTTKPIGFNVGIPPLMPGETNGPDSKLNEINTTLHGIPEPSAPGSQSVPPSYESVVSDHAKDAGTSAKDLNLPVFPNLPDVPSDDDDPKHLGGNDGGSSKPNDDFDFDDLKRRFDELKNKRN